MKYVIKIMCTLTLISGCALMKAADQKDAPKNAISNTAIADKTSNSDLLDAERKTVAAQAQVAPLQKASEEAIVKEFFFLLKRQNFLN